MDMNKVTKNKYIQKQLRYNPPKKSFDSNE